MYKLAIILVFFLENALCFAEGEKVQLKESPLTIEQIAQFLNLNGRNYKFSTESPLYLSFILDGKVISTLKPSKSHDFFFYYHLEHLATEEKLQIWYGCNTHYPTKVAGSDLVWQASDGVSYYNIIFLRELYDFKMELPSSLTTDETMTVLDFTKKGEKTSLFKFQILLSINPPKS